MTWYPSNVSAQRRPPHSQAQPANLECRRNRKAAAVRCSALSDAGLFRISTNRLRQSASLAPSWFQAGISGQLAILRLHDNLGPGTIIRHGTELAPAPSLRYGAERRYPAREEQY